jgi:hypothetical protein
MKQSAKKKLLIALVATLTLLALPAGIFGWIAHTAHRSVPGRIVRWFSGEPTALQWTNDKAEDIRTKPEWATLQSWAIETLKGFQNGTLRTNKDTGVFGGVRVAPEELPSFIKGTPVVEILRSTDGKPNCVVVLWYIAGIVVGPPEYRMSLQPWCFTEAKSGIFAFYLEK